MIEKYLKKGVILTEYNFEEAGGTPLSEVSVGIRNGEMTLTKTKKIPRCCGLMSKTETKVRQINFRFLPYAEGAINYCESMGVDVISAYFSGCIMARYKRSGSWRVCHVSTGGGNDCKSKWEGIKSESTVSDVTEFNPFDSARSAKTLGLITATGQLYAIGCDMQTGLGKPALRIDTCVLVL